MFLLTLMKMLMNVENNNKKDPIKRPGQNIIHNVMHYFIAFISATNNCTFCVAFMIQNIFLLAILIPKKVGQRTSNCLF